MNYPRCDVCDCYVLPPPDDLPLGTVDFIHGPIYHGYEGYNGHRLCIKACQDEAEWGTPMAEAVRRQRQHWVNAPKMP